MNDVYMQYDESPFFSDLKKEVDLYFSSRGISMRGNTAMKIKTFSLVIFYLVCCILLYFIPLVKSTILLAYLLMGFTSSLIMVNISHDAAHGSIFESQFLNRLMSYTFNLVGSNEYVWRLTHNLVHHNYPNVADTDPDIDQGPLVRISPALPRYKFHRYQHYYAPLLYSVFSLYLVFIKDFRLLFGKKKIGHIVYQKHPTGEIIILFVSKILFLAYILALPILFIPVSWKVIVAGFLIYSVIQSIVITLLTAPVHVTEEASFKYEFGKEETAVKDWVSRQVETTTDFKVRNPVIDFFLGGANYQVIHHLFPQVAHIHFRSLTGILKEKSHQYKVPYLCFPFWKACLSHLKQLKYFGTHDN